MDRPAISPAAQRDYDRIVERVGQEPGVTAGKLFGMPALLLDRKAFAGLYGDAMVFKLSGEGHAAALGLAGAELFDPSRLGRPMKTWVVGRGSDHTRQEMGQAGRPGPGGRQVRTLTTWPTAGWPLPSR